MKILKLTAENVKKLRAVEITPTGELVEITGRNGQGKTSVLDAIWWALAGTKHIQAVPIRRGATKARIRLDLGELTVERRFTGKSARTDGASTLVVENAEGARYTSPQAMLDALIGALTFDPLAFVTQEPREQFESLRRIVPLDVDLDQLDGLNRRDFDQRTQASRDAKALRAQADGIRVPDGTPEAAVDTAALMDRMADASKTNADIETRRGRREQAAREIENLTRRVDDDRVEAVRLRDQSARLDADAATLAAQAMATQQKLDTAEPLPAPVDIDAIRAELTDAATINRHVEQRARKGKLTADAAALEAAAHALTETMDARTQAKTDALAKAPMPVEGLGFGEGVVTFDGLPFDQAETSAQIRVGVAIAMKMNPKLRVIRIKEGSCLDADNVAMVAAMARENDYQIWMERVDMSGKIGVVIEDGMVIAVDGEPVEPADAETTA